MRTWMEPAAAIILIPVITIAGQWLLSQQAAKAQYTDLVAKLEAARNTHTEQAGAAAQRNWSELSQGGDPLAVLPQNVRTHLCLAPAPELLELPAAPAKDYDFRSVWDLFGVWQLMALTTVADRYARLAAAIKEGCSVVQPGKGTGAG